MNRPKIFQIGFNKTGTTSLARFFKANGYAVCGGFTAKRIFKNVRAGLDPFAWLEHVDVFQDQENHKEGIYTYELFREIHQSRPETYFVLTTRDCESWIRSRLSHNAGQYVRIALRHRGLTDVEELVEQWRNEFAEYHRQVAEFFADKRNLYVHDLSCISVDGLADFVAEHYQLDRAMPYPRVRTGRRGPPSYSLDHPD